VGGWGWGGGSQVTTGDNWSEIARGLFPDGVIASGVSKLVNWLGAWVPDLLEILFRVSKGFSRVF
jgi:hypothetical protein